MSKDLLLDSAFPEDVITEESVGVVVYFKAKEKLKYIALLLEKDEFMKTGLSSNRHLGGKPIIQIQERIKEESND